MARTIRIKVYEFDELKSEKAKQKAIEWYRSGIDTRDWFDYVQDDAKTIQLEIPEVDVYYRTIKIQFEHSAQSTARLILENHGEVCETYKLAESFLSEWNTMEHESEYYLTNDDEEVIGRFRKALAQEYLKMFIDEYEHVNSDEYIIEILQINEYTFTEDGKRFG